MDKFGLRLENLREQYGYTKKEVSFKLGFSANVYGSYEREERRPSFETLIKLADLYDVSLDYLIRGKEYSSEETSDDINAFKTILKHFNEQGFDKPFIIDHEKWIILNKRDLEELSNHFEWVVTKARDRIK